MSSEEREGTLKGTQASRLNILNGKVMWFFLPQGRSQNVGHPSLGSIPCSFSALFPRSWAQGRPASKQRKNKHISKNPSLGVGKHEGMSGRKKAKRQRGQWFIFLLLLRVCCGEITKGFTFLEEKQNADIEGTWRAWAFPERHARPHKKKEVCTWENLFISFYVKGLGGRSLGGRSGEHEKMRTASFSENTNITVTLSFRIRNKTWSPFYSHLMNWHINSFHVFLGHFLLLNISCKSWDRSFFAFSCS